MAKHKVSELEGALLDLAVAKAEGLPVHPGRSRFVVAGTVDTVYADQINPSWRWQDGGPIIARERIAIWMAGDQWRANMPGDSAYLGDSDWIDCGLHDGSRGPTPLVAAMRAYVDSKFGEWVDL